MADIIQIRRDTAANWTSANPVLAQAELGIETDTQKVKCGDGTTAWSSLSYLIDTGGYAAYSDATANFTGDLQKNGVSVPSYADTTANFTGALQKSGVPVAADANLNSFISAVDLPTADGSADQILKTDGSGTVSFADAAAGGSVTYAPTAGTEVFAENFNEWMSTQGYGSVQSAGGTSYLSVMRGRDSTATNKAKSNRFIIYFPYTETNGARQAGNYMDGYASTSFSCTPSTRTITWNSSSQSYDRFQYHTNYSSNAHSTQQYWTIDGSGQSCLNGNIVWNGQSSHQFTIATFAWNDSGIYQGSNTSVGAGSGLHHSNGDRLVLPIDNSASGYILNTGYNQANSLASYKIITFQGSTSAPTIGGMTTCSNTTSSTVETVNMINQPDIYPSSTYNYPLHIVNYNVSGNYSKQCVNYQGSVSGEINSGFDRTQYSGQIAFLLMDGSTPVVMMYDNYWSASRWTSYNSSPTYFPSTARRWKPKHSISYGGRGGFVATGVENEFICFDGQMPFQESYYTGMVSLKKFKINPQNGEFTDVYYCEMDASVQGWWSKTDQNGFYKLYALWGDDGNSSTITHLLVVRLDANYVRYQHAAQIIDIPAAADWKAYPTN